MARSVSGGMGAGLADDDLVVVNDTTAPREVVLRTARDGDVRTDRLVVDAGDVAAIPSPDGSGSLIVEVDTDHGEHASLTADGAALVVVRDRTVLVSE